MPYSLKGKLVIAIASSALFDLRKSDKVYRERGAEAYRRYQRKNEDVPLDPGVAFPFIKRLLDLNRDPAHKAAQPVEVILLSRNDHDTGLRVFNSCEHHSLPISRGGFVSGQKPQDYVHAFEACLFLSADKKSVEDAMVNGVPAGRVLGSHYTDDPHDEELRIAFDFDGVVADDSAEKVYQKKGLKKFHQTELAKALTPHNQGPLAQLLMRIRDIQKLEVKYARNHPRYVRKVRTALITARNAPAHKRVITTLREWGIEIDQTFWLGGLDKNRILKQFRPHIFFDDQMLHAGPASGEVPAVHVPVSLLRKAAATPVRTASTKARAGGKRLQNAKAKTKVRRAARRR